jgi:molybdenum cofactor biosynthesis enzyme MoaA
MQLEQIGFYTLDDNRCQNASATSRMMRCELILTDACTFKCPYCRGLRKDIAGTMSLEKAKGIVNIWAKDNLKNIRLSGGEPTIYKHIIELVEYIKSKGIERIAISTNGYSDFELYQKLIDAGVNDFSVSLDACCASFGDMMSGGVNGSWNKVIDNIKKLSQLVYTTVGIVVTDETVNQLPETVAFASSLSVADIRIISAAQYNEILDSANNIGESVYEKYPILKYRINNLKSGRNVRGIQDNDSNQCGLVLDDMAIAGDYHFPCIIYMREQGNPIGKIGDNMRHERLEWMKNHNTHTDPICQKNCLDVCIDYNNKFKEFNDKNI